jgi:hypothetical protein
MLPVVSRIWIKSISPLSPMKASRALRWAPFPISCSLSAMLHCRSHRLSHRLEAPLRGQVQTRLIPPLHHDSSICRRRPCQEHLTPHLDSEVQSAMQTKPETSSSSTLLVEYEYQEAAGIQILPRKRFISRTPGMQEKWTNQYRRAARDKRKREGIAFTDEKESWRKPAIILKRIWTR